MRKYISILLFLASAALLYAAWTQRGSDDFFPCTSGQGHSGADISPASSANWVNMGVGTYTCNGGANGAAGVNVGSTNHAVYYYNVSTLADQYSQATMLVVPPDANACAIGPAVRIQASGENAYFLEYENSAGTKNLKLGKVNAGTITLIVTTAKTYVATNKLRLEAVGTGSATRLTAYEDTGSGFVAVGTMTSIDPGATYIDGGKPGIWGIGPNSNAELDDWSGGDQPAAAAGSNKFFNLFVP